LFQLLASQIGFFYGCAVFIQTGQTRAFFAESQAEVFGSMPGGDAVQTVVAPDGGDLCAMDSAVYFVSQGKS
jgi:hypothetical protein